MTAPNWPNRTIFHGDNLDILRGMNSESVDLIATDPPFNKNKDFHATPDSLASGGSFQDRWNWDRDVHDEWIDSILDPHPKLWGAIEAARYTHSDSMGAFLCFLSVRTLAMHRILKQTGSLYLHCDTTANGYIRMMLDAIFGAENFRNEIIWHYSKGHGPKKDLRRKHDSIFRYAKSKDFHFDPPAYPHLNSQLYRFDKTDADGRKYRINHTRDADGNMKRFYLDEGVKCDDVWSFVRESEIDSLPHNAKEQTGFRTQKPLALYERIIKASCPEGGVVLDPFAGCATTCVAAERLGRQWVGIDLWDKCRFVIQHRLANERLPCTSIGASEPPVRTDDIKSDVQPFATPKGKPKSKKSMPDWKIRIELIKRDGLKCQGCGLIPPGEDDRYLELDHDKPKSEGGSNEIHNRNLLCGPCNRTKKDTLTLTGLRKFNRKNKLIKGPLP